ncbi:MAG: YaiI/YqxD family protein [Gammaproteobacteria bacterium]|nr:YaiI/YqxD family protein [Gammaproteobacteria bacterium]MCH9715876.1 YaiI/YqxD family protein [Gammaproteobacteria bacterium]MCH9763700.1 YaiI/YqxD family protein [Gammaproteobacteria bacterium]
MTIWLDGDACPKPIKDVLCRAATRTQTQLIIVANHFFQTPPSPFIKKQLVGAGFDVADNYIVAHLTPGDLVITADIPLADEAISKGGTVINPRGVLYSAHNIKQHLASRNMNESLRSSGLISGGPSKLGAKEIQQFSIHLDRFLTKQRKPLS